MSSRFAELRAKAEAAANSAKEAANAKMADYRGDKKPEKPVYKPPPPRPLVKPSLPSDANRPTKAAGGYDVEEPQPEEVEEEPVQVKEGNPVRRAALARTVVQDIMDEENDGKGIAILLQNKELFFQFLDDFFAAKGFDVRSRLPVSQEQEQGIEKHEGAEPEEGGKATLQEDDSGTPAETHHQHHQEEEEPSIPLPPPPSRRAPKARASTRSPDGERDKGQAPVRPTPRRLPPPIAPKPEKDANSDAEGISGLPQRTVPSRSSSPKPSPAVQAIFANLRPRPAPEATAPFIPPTYTGSARRSLSSTSSVSSTPPEDERARGNDRLSKHPPKPPSKSVAPTPASYDPSGAPPPVPHSTRPPPVNRASRPTAPSRSSHLSTTASSVFAQGQAATRKKGQRSIGGPPSLFFTNETNGEWTPPFPYGYMPGAGKEATDGQCSAAQLCSFFAESVSWDGWYTVEDPSARPTSIVDRVEVRWKGSVMHSQETKKRLFGADKTKTERCRIGVVTFQDLSIAWYRVTWKEEDPVKSLKREARYRASPSSWSGEKLYAAHLLYGQAITDFCERAIRMRQLVGGGEAYDLANGALTSLAKYKPHAPPVIPSVGHCHGHLIYEGYVDEGNGKTWGATRGGETAIRNGDIIEWCDAQVQLKDENDEVTIFSFGSGYPSVILSAVEFPERLEEDEQTLPPTRLPDLEIVMQSAASGMAPTRKLALLSTLVKGRIWIFRSVGWDYVGLDTEPNAEWPPPDPTLFLPS